MVLTENPNSGVGREDYQATNCELLFKWYSYLKNSGLLVDGIVYWLPVLFFWNILTVD